ncbi:long chronological lifespan protein 2 [Cryptococcus depauperatus CBS 7841]|uniref:Long chronological lifespan protein 2 n=1 Tax=Cryptococcus depauperatus CBS 7841 TaxID=1295531 RepID=A0A1E3IRQ6_9TREE|nr:long chronological lifespan protein 2 [Cryptococcus depauperatus CBS 7841]
MRFLILSLSLLPLVFAQFGHFFQQGGFPFGGGQQQQQRQQSQDQPERRYKGWTEAERVHCRAGYVCPASLACVPTPADCPCPYPEDVKCPLPDNRPRDEGEGPPFVCVRGNDGCAQIVQFAKPI